MAGIVFLVFGVFLILAVPLAVSMMLGAWTPVIFGAPGISGVGQIIRNAFSGADTTPMIAVPLFILGGVIMSEGGISKKLFNVFAYIFGKKTGGLPIAVLLTTMFYGSISGSAVAVTAAVGSMAIPFLTEMGYEKKFIAAMIAVAGGLGIILPPSIPMVMYSLATGVSTGELFLAGIFPGILVTGFLIAYAVYYCWRKGEDKAKIAAAVDEMRKTSFLLILKDSFWALLSPIIILGGIYSGIFTPTEAACVSVFYALVISVFIYRTVPLKGVLKLLCNAVKTYSSLCFMIAFAIAFGRTLTLLKAPDMISNFVLGVSQSKVVIVFVIIVIFYMIGMVMDIGPVIVIMAPILLPIVKALGVDPVHFGIFMVVNLAISMATPPFGLNVFVTSNISELPPTTVFRMAIPFIIMFTIALLVIAYVPAISLFILGRA